MGIKETFIQYLDEIKVKLVEANVLTDDAVYTKIYQMRQFFEQVELDGDAEMPDADNLPVQSFGNDDLGMFLNTIFGDQSLDEKRQIESELIDIYWPGRENLSDEEMMKEKYYDSQHLFQFVISLKRYVETTGDGWCEPFEHGWSFGHARGL